MRRLAVLVPALCALLLGAVLGLRWSDGDGAAAAWRAAAAAPRQAETSPDAPAAPAPEPAPAPERAPMTEQPQAPVTPAPPRSRAIGHPWKGRLAHGVRLPASGAGFFTWDWGRRASPNAPWRRHGTDVLVEWVQAVVAGYRAESPGAPRVGIADLSRTNGGNFGPEIGGGMGHASHQNGLDVDVLYPRRDRLERPARRAAQVDRRLAQRLVDAFVRAGAEKAFVGHGVRLKGPKGVVVALDHHDDHVHVRIAKKAVDLWAAPLGVR